MPVPRRHTLTTRFSRLFEPGHIGPLRVPNRIVMAPMGTNLAEPDGRYSRRQIDYFVERARGGVGLIITEATKVEARVEPPSLVGMPLSRADSDLAIPAMADLADAVHFYGARVAIQLSSGFGRNADRVGPGNPPVSASAVSAFANPAVTARALTREEIGAIVEAMGRAAGRAAAAGFDAVEIHAHTGYLADQFMSSQWNRRADEYGGSLENRMRFPLGLIAAARKAVGAGVAITFRYSLVQEVPGGREIEESLEIARMLESAGVDALHVDVGCYEAADRTLIYRPDGCLADLAGAVKDVVHIPVIAVGRMTPEAGEAALESGKADFIASGRGLLADPEWPRKVREGRRDDVRPCVHCNEGCLGRLHDLKTVTCSVNPRCGNERFLEIREAEAKKKVVVVGGGPSGLEAARVAATRGHQVTLMEREQRLGGALNAVSPLSFKQEFGDLVRWWETALGKLHVEVRLGVEATPETAEVRDADAVVLACGAATGRPSLPGSDGDHVVDLVDYQLGRKTVRGQRVVVVGGGQFGCDAALDLAMKGRAVTVVEACDTIASDLNPISRRSLLWMLAEHGVQVLAGVGVVRVRPDGVVVRTAQGEERAIEADTVVLVERPRADDSLRAAYESTRSEVHVIGDCCDPGKIGDAVLAGFSAGCRI